jgi:hypothetical protein
MEMHVEGLPELRQKLGRLDDGLKRHINDAMQFEAEAMKKMARARLGAAAPYAVYQEFGTRYVRARRFLGKAVEFRMLVPVNRLSRAISQAIREAGGS